MIIAGAVAADNEVGGGAAPRQLEAQHDQVTDSDSVVTV
jgi:hypothetical protein